MKGWLALVLAVALASCATTEGTLLGETLATDAEDTTEGSASPDKPETQAPEPEPDEESKGLAIITDPPGAVVRSGFEVLGITPLDLEDLEPGSYRFTIEREGYRSIDLWIDYKGVPQTYTAVLEEITGFLRVNATPQTASVTVDGMDLDPAGERLRIGSYQVLVRAFGYVDHLERVRVLEDALTLVDVSLEKAPFALTALSSTRAVFSPSSYGTLGQTRILFSVTAPGAATLTIRDEAGSVVHEESFPDLDTWDHSATWTGRDAEGRPLPDGVYAVEVAGTGADGVVAAPRAAEVRIDAEALIEYRSLVSGAAGLAYVPSPRTLPPGALQISALAVAFVGQVEGVSSYRVPVALGLRYGLAPLEVDVQAGTYLSSAAAADVAPLYASVSARGGLLRTGGTVGLSLAVGGRLTYHVLSSDTLTNFTGLALHAPLGLRLGPVEVLATPELVVSYRRVGVSGEEAAFWVWGYTRAGLLVSAGPVVAGVSTALRLRPFTEGLGIQMPMPLAAEAHITIPGTSIVLSVALAAEIESAGSYYLMGGGGFGFLN